MSRPGAEHVRFPIGVRCIRFVVMLLLGWAAVADAQGGSPLPIRIAWQTDPNVPFYVARDKGWFEEAGLRPQYLKFLAAPPMFAALQSESVDVADMGLAPAIIGRAQGIDIRLVMVAVEVSPANVLVAREGVSVASARDLKGKRVAAQKGTSAYFGLIRYLERDGLPMTDLQYVDLNAPNTIPAFKKGEIDAVWIWPPWQNLLVSAGGRRIISSQDVGALAPQVWAVRAQWAKSNPEALQRFLRVLGRAASEIAANADLATKQLSETFGVTPEVASDILKGNEYPPLELQGSASYALSLVSGRPGATAGLGLATKRAAAFLQSQGLLNTAVNPDDFIDPEPLRRALQKGK